MKACISLTQDEEGNPLLQYEQMLSLIKKEYHGKAFEGNQCQKFIKEENLNKLRNLLIEAAMPEDLVDNFLQCFLDIGSVYTSCCGSSLDPSHRQVTNNLKNSWGSLVEDPRVTLTWPNTVHHIVDHFSDYFEDPLTSGEPLGYTSDQITEHMHSYIDKTFKKSGYWITDPTSELCAKKQHEGILQINGFSVNIH